ncbi:hypothetical protein EDC30_109112 [Paucimonas lemoignei]|uniref:Bacteriophage Rz lysis protein n=1 Tax=Paucimonas lemoignei TaxID=29443 RepID=A0A4R3HTL5_PAULE|nr:hypothetical protein [Paucimonas lemoignei]TCS35813.1 hypothetical protein EDC30_109112 [Paucimonas lemoignei]
MNLIRMGIYAVIAAAVVAVLAAITHGIYTHGYNAADAKWLKRETERKDIELASIQEELQAQEILKGQYEHEKQLLKKGHADEIAKSRALSAAAPRLRISAEICGELAVEAEADRAGGSNGGDPRTRLVPERVDQDFRALELKIEHVFAGCRVAQGHLQQNGMAP